MKRTRQACLAIGSLTAIVLALALGQDVRGAAGPDPAPQRPAQAEASVSPSPDASASPTPSPDAPPTGTPDASPTTPPSATPVPTPTEELPGVPYDALVQAQMTWDQLEAFEPGPAPDPTWTAEFDGGQVVNSEPVQTIWLGMWEVDVPSPGGLVTATVSAGPPDKFRVVDVFCMDSASNLVPSTVQGQSVVFAFDAVPDGRSNYECHFIFDPALLPRPTPFPTTPPLPATDTLVEGKVWDVDGSSWLALAVLAGVVAGAVVVAALSRRRTTLS
jgi:hypothetical protein